MKGKKARKKAPKGPERGENPPKVAPNPRLGAQTRKLLGKHYASKYHTGRR